jgi:4'-phosphopantetheinyl transferase
MTQRQLMRSCELWLVDALASSAALEALERETKCLSADDRRRLAAVRDGERRRTRRAAAIAVRVLLERHLGPCVRGIAFRRTRGGKPSLPTALGQLMFSVSHAGRHVLIGLSGTGPIGVDLEPARTLRLPAQRRAALVAIGAGLGLAIPDAADPDSAALRAWVRIEAFAKARGTGVGRLLEEAGVRADTAGARGTERARRLAAAARLSTHDVPVSLGLNAAACVPNGVRIGRPRPFPAIRAAICGLVTDGARSSRLRTS